MDSKIKEAVAYLKEKNEYRRIMRELQLKYKKTGKLTGSITLEGLEEREVLLLAPLNSELYEVKGGKINIRKFIEYFSRGKFEGIDFLEVLKEYFKEDLKTNKEIQEEKDLKKESFFQELIGKIGNNQAEMWLMSVLELKKFGYNIILKLYNEDKKMLRTVLYNVAKGLGSLSYDSRKLIPLATFSSNITRDSHYFDVGTSAGKLLINALAYLKGVRNIGNAEGINDLLYSVGLLRDEISNSTITAGLYAYDKEGELEGTKWFRRERQPIILSIYNLNRFERLRAKGDRVFVFENPTVFYEVLKRCEKDNPTLLCISGQPNLSSLIILDKLEEADSTIYYSGDFDPEGLQIADNLKKRYGDRLIIWGMTKENYDKIKGNNSFEDRINKLDNIESPQLKELVEEMKITAVAAYQELLVDYYCKDIYRLCGNNIKNDGL